MPEFTDDMLREAEGVLEDSIIASYGVPTKYQPQSNNASQIGHECPFYLWAIRARHEDMPTPGAWLPGIWELGREAENAAKIALLQEGWALHKTEVTFEDADMQIRGRLDWELSKPGSESPVWHKPIPTEFKGVSANYMDQLRTFEDCFESPMKWVRKWPMQTLSYAYMMPDERPVVCLLMRNKTNARPRAIIERVEDHFNRLVDMGERVAEVNACLRDGGNPTPITYHPVWCKDCDAAHICPTMAHHSYGNPVAQLEDASTIERYARQWEEGRVQKKASESAWEEMKSIGKHYGLYTAKPGEIRSVLGETFMFSVSTSAKGAQTFKCQRIEEKEAGRDGDG